MELNPIITLQIPRMRSVIKNPACEELAHIRKDLGFSMDDMAKALGYAGGSSYQYYEDPELYKKDYFETSFINRLKKHLTPLGIEAERIDRLGSSGSPGKLEAIDLELMELCTSAVSKMIRDHGLNPSDIEKAKWPARVYNFIVKQRRLGKDIMPDETIAAAILLMGA